MTIKNILALLALLLLSGPALAVKSDADRRDFAAEDHQSIDESKDRQSVWRHGDLVSNDGMFTLQWIGNGNLNQQFRIVEHNPGNIVQYFPAEDRDEIFFYKPRSGNYHYELQHCNPNNPQNCNTVGQPVSVTIALGTDAKSSQAKDTCSGTLCGGADQMTPGQWWDPSRPGHGWDVHWNNKRGPNQNPTSADAYELVVYRYTYQLIAGGGGKWRPVWMKAELSLSGDEYTGDFLYCTNTTGTPACNDAGELRISFQTDENYAHYEIVIDTVQYPGFSPGGSGNLEYFGEAVTGSTSSPYSYFNGVWVPADTATHKFIFSDWIRSNYQSFVVSFYDDAGKPVWGRGESNYPGTGSLKGMAIWLIEEGYNQVTLPPYGYDPADYFYYLGTFKRQYFDALSGEAYGRLRLPSYRPGELNVLHTAREPIYRQARAHDIWYELDGDPTISYCSTYVHGDCTLDVSWLADLDLDAGSIYWSTGTTPTPSIKLADLTETTIDFPFLGTPTSSAQQFQMFNAQYHYQGDEIAKTNPYFVNNDAISPDLPVLSVPESTADDYTLTWTWAGNATTHFKLDYKIGAGGSWVMLEDDFRVFQVDRSVQYIATPPASGEYYFRVAACNFSECSTWVESSVMKAAVDTIGTLTADQLQKVVGETVSIQWSVAPSEKVILEHRIITPGSVPAEDQTPFDFVAEFTTQTSTAYVLNDGGRHEFRVRGCYVLASGDVCDANGLVSELVAAVPTSPQNLAVTGNPDGSFDFTWDASTLGGPLTYQLEKIGRGDTNLETPDPSAPEWVVIQSGIAATTTQKAPDPGTYYYQVRACNDGGCSESTNSVLWDGWENYPIPDPIDSLTASFIDQDTMEFTATWTHPNPQDLAYYEVWLTHPSYRGLKQADSRVIGTPSGATSITYTPIDIPVGDFRIQVNACDSFDVCGKGLAHEFLLEQPVPTAPSWVDVQPITSLQDFRISWDPSPSVNATHYKVQEFIGGLPADLDADGLDLARTLIGVFERVEYRIQACNSDYECSPTPNNFVFWHILPPLENVRFQGWIDEFEGKFLLGWDFVYPQYNGFAVPSGAHFNVREANVGPQSNGQWQTTSPTGMSIQNLCGTYTYSAAICMGGWNQLVDPIWCSAFTPRHAIVVKIENSTDCIEPPSIPENLRGRWLNKVSYQYEILWDESDTGDAEFYYVRETKPDIDPTHEYIQTVTETKSSPFVNSTEGDYLYEVKACKTKQVNAAGTMEESCSDYSPPFTWTIDERAIDTPPEPLTFKQLDPTVWQLPAGSSNVGDTDGSFNVDQSGNATYSIPIMAAPGTGGLNPQISLNYSSQGGNGPVGVGWSLGGLSAISRCGQTREIDNVARNTGVQLTSEDRFCLDGQRLIAETGEYGEAGTTYRKELDDFTKVTSIGGSLIDGPATFEVRRKDGSISEYGNTTDSSISAGLGNGVKLAWAINKFQDSSGNEIDFAYMHPGSGADPSTYFTDGTVEYHIQSITYAGGFNEIRFTYNPARSDVPNRHVGGATLVTSQRLVGIESLGIKDAPVSGITAPAKYPLRYYVLDTSGKDSVGRHRLASVTECNRNSADRTCYPPTQFTWTDGHVGFDAPSGVNLLSANVWSVKFLDANGDGRQDVAYTAHDGNPTGSRSLNLRLSTGQRTAGDEFAPVSNLGGFPSAAESYDLTQTKLGWGVLDFDNDGFQDIVFAGDDNSWHARRGDAAAPLSVEIGSLGSLGGLVPQALQVMDYDGDGRADLMFMTEDETNLYVSLGTGSGFDTALPVGNGFSALALYLESKNLITDATGLVLTPLFGTVVDYNGDGAADVLMRVQVRQCTVNGVVQVCDGLDPLAATRLANDQQATSFDGAIAYDALHFAWGDPVSNQLAIDTSAAVLSLVNYDIFPPDNQPLINDPCFESNPADCELNEQVTPIDLNADGLADLGYFREGLDSNGDHTYQFAINLGAGQFAPWGEVTGVPNAERVMLRDYNGDRLPDFWYVDGSDNWQVLINSGGFIDRYSLLIQNVSTAGAVDDRNYMADFDGDGREDLVSYRFPVTGSHVTFSCQATDTTGDITTNPNYQSCLWSPLSKIEMITDGYGATTNVSYAPLTDGNVFSRDDDGQMAATNPAMGDSVVYPINVPIYVAGSVSQSSPTATNPNDFLAVDYHYTGARLKAGGRGFLGFETVESTELQDGVRTKTTYRQDFPYVGAPLSIERTTQDGLVTLGSVVNTWAHQLTTAKPTYYTFVASSEETNHSLAGAVLSTVVTTNSYSGGSNCGSYGNVCTVTVETYEGVKDAGEAFVARQSTDNEYSDNTTLWQLGRLTSSTATSDRRVDGVLLEQEIRRSEFVYDPAKGLLTDERVCANATSCTTGQWRNTHHTLDAFGNRWKTTVTGSDLDAPRETEVEFDPLGRYAMKSWNASDVLVQQVAEFNQYGKGVEILDRLDAPGHTIGDTPSTLVLHDDMGREYFSFHKQGMWQRVWKSATYYLCPTGSGRGVTAYAEQSKGADGSEGFACYDGLGREIRSGTLAFDGIQFRAIDTEYDQKGRVSRTSIPYFMDSAVDQPGGWTATTYDLLGRPIDVSSPDTSRVNYDYQGLTTIIRTYGDEGGSVLHSARQEIRDVLGNSVSIEENPLSILSVTPEENTLISYQYDALGNLTEVDGPLEGTVDVITIVYDDFGNRISLTDPDAGLNTYYYNVLGELICERDAADEGVRYGYDAQGRKKSETLMTGLTDATNSCTGSATVSTSTWTYFASAGYGAGQLANEYGAGLSRDYQYDRFGRLSTVTTNINGDIYTQTTTYDDIGRIFQQFDVTGEGTVNRYNDQGYLLRVCDVRGLADQFIHEEIETMDARGNVTRVRYNGEGCYDPLAGGFDITRLWNYDDLTGRIENQTSGGAIQMLDYTYDEVGNLETRTDTGNTTDIANPKDLAEVFTYDRLNRLKDSTVSYGGGAAVGTLSLDYDESGNILYKLGVGSYDYNGPRPHAASAVNGVVQQYDAKGNRKVAGSQSIDYNVYNKPTYIVDSGETVNFEYGPDRARFRKVENAGAGQTETFYLGNVELIIGPNGREFRRYPTSSSVLSFVDSIDDGALTDGETVTHRMLFKDHLGSLNVITDATGQIEQLASFDAFGQRRSALSIGQVLNSGSTETIALLQVTARGFTGHEMLDGVGLVHMNGRVYDPAIGRFLSVDPIVSQPWNGQRFNRYSYVLNNPLRFTDPSGYDPDCFEDGCSDASFNWYPSWYKHLLPRVFGGSVDQVRIDGFEPGGTVSNLFTSQVVTTSQKSRLYVVFETRASKEKRDILTVVASRAGKSGKSTTSIPISTGVIGELSADGFGPPAPFATADQAAKAGIEISVESSRKYEYGGAVIAVESGYYATSPVTNGDPRHVRFGVERGLKVVAIFHTHPAGKDSLLYSDDDISMAQELNIKSYIGFLDTRSIHYWDPTWRPRYRGRGARRILNEKGRKLCSDCF